MENGGCGTAHHTHHSADASRDSSSAGPTPGRSATGAPAAIKRFRSIVNTRRRSKEASVKALRRATAGRRYPGGIADAAFASTAVLNTSSPLSITMSRAQLSPGSRHTARELNNRVNQIARRRASAARNASHSSDQGPGAHKGSSVNHGDALISSLGNIRGGPQLTEGPFCDRGLPSASPTALRQQEVTPFFNFYRTRDGSRR